MDDKKIKIKEVIVVEGRDDTTAVKNSVCAMTIETHGYGINPATWNLIEKAYNTAGIIVFTDPDHAGEQIRRRILDRFPKAKEAFLDRSLAEKNGNIGIENAAAADIVDALKKAHCVIQDDQTGGITAADMFAWGLAGSEGASSRRKALGNILGIGYANAAAFAARLNKFGITEETVKTAFEKI